MHFTKPVTDRTAHFDYCCAQPAPIPDRVWSQGVGTMRSMDYTVCNQQKSVTKHTAEDKGVESIFDNSLLPFLLDDLTCNERDTLEYDLTLAARIQQTLLPLPGSSPSGWDVCYHYAPAGILTGDYCDLVESEAGLLFLFGDVCGKGVSAPTLMSHLHATFRSLADRNLPLDVMVEAANRNFVSRVQGGQFATMVAGLAAADGSVDFVNAGHLPLLHLHKGTIRCESATGVPLGLLAGARFPSRRFLLDPGDTLFVSTDGVTEARNGTGEEYGIERLKKLIAKHPLVTLSQLISECLADLSEFMAETERTDDLALLAIRRTAPALCEVGCLPPVAVSMRGKLEGVNS
jgi:phosphoserine phosphatase RsbU/P